MNPLLLGGFGVRVRVNRIRSLSELWVMDGRRDKDLPRMFRFKPRQCPYTSIVINGHSGYVTLQALHWLSRNNVPLFIMNYDGSVISSILPPTITQTRLRAAQFRAANDHETKFKIAKALVQAKIAVSLALLGQFGQGCDIEREIGLTKREAEKLHKASTVAQLQTVEGRVALRYWQAYRKALPEPLGFQGRTTGTHNYNAADPVNLALNYGYGFLQCEVRMAINAVGLELGVGFLHEGADYQTKQALVFDLMEPFRFLVDIAVMQAFESGKLDAQSFHFTEHDYRYHFQLDAKGRFLDVLRETFNSGVKYKGRVLKWDTLIQEKTAELARYLIGARPALDFSELNPVLERSDDQALRQTILNLTQSHAREHGIGKSTLHYLKRRARAGQPFRISSKVQGRLPRDLSDCLSERLQVTRHPLRREQSP
jgi:CRISPR-associated protein Cas1